MQEHSSQGRKETGAKGAVVLVVEDETLLRMQAIDVIERAGFVVLEAANADQAIQILESRDDVRVVFTDVDMPGSMDGLKLAHAIRGRWPPIELIVTSGHYTVNAGELPARGRFLPKPYQSEEVVQSLRELAA